MCDGADLDAIIESRPAEMVTLSAPEWDQLTDLRESGDFDADFDAGFQNGREFFVARGCIEWASASNHRMDRRTASAGR